MPHAVTLQLPDALVSMARAEADRSERDVETILLQWIEKGGRDDLQMLGDNQILEICDSSMDESAQRVLSDLQAKDREGNLTESDRLKLQRLMEQYQSGLLRKAKAWQIAVGRGLRQLPPLK